MRFAVRNEVATACASALGRILRLRWYAVVAVDGVIKLAVNGRFVNGDRPYVAEEGVPGLQSEGAEIHFRNIRILELLPGVTTPEQTAPDLL